MMKYANISFDKLRSLLLRYKLSFAIAIAIVAALFLTLLSMALYTITGTDKLDLSRPGYEAARQQVKKQAPATSDFSAEGELNKKVLDGYLKSYKKQSDELTGFDNFGKKVIEDTQLGFGAEQMPPPTAEASP